MLALIFVKQKKRLGGVNSDVLQSALIQYNIVTKFDNILKCHVFSVCTTFMLLYMFWNILLCIILVIIKVIVLCLFYYQWQEQYEQYYIKINEILWNCAPFFFYFC